ncbi:hypothetical protein EFR01_59760 [Sinorhizobium fredii]|nr:hypothetical protein EFR01_59760 [Sinorhizobium fredii]GLS07198.1 hypothetical protein GCM10007864_08240 [Sinorhizobium fredii]
MRAGIGSGGGALGGFYVTALVILSRPSGARLVSQVAPDLFPANVNLREGSRDD